jgi:hypothetical protein
MNQLSSRCHGWVDQLFQIGELVDPVVPRNPPAVPLHSAEFGDWNAPSQRDLHHLEDQMEIDPAPQKWEGEEFPGAAATYEQGTSFLERFDQDQYSEEWRSNIYYLFASHADWELGLWLTRSGLSMAATDSLLSLALVSCIMSCIHMLSNIAQLKTLPISFRTAQQLRGLVELLPKGPEWRYRVLQTKLTKAPVKFFYHDTVQCLEALFNHPLFHDKMDLIPRRIYHTAERLVHVYTEWITGDVAWQMQVTLFLPPDLLVSD